VACLLKALERVDMFEKRRAYLPEPANRTIEWFAYALREISDSRVLEPYLEKRRLRKA
jgi:hypothetical protein